MRCTNLTQSAGSSTTRTPVPTPHNPEVAGSNPAPATTKALHSGAFRLSGTRLAPRGRADDSGGRIIALLDGRLDRASSLRSERLACRIGDVAALEPVHGFPRDIHTGPYLSSVRGGRPDRPRSPNVLLLGRHPLRFPDPPLLGHA